jgi:integrase/recombinase XerC
MPQPLIDSFRQYLAIQRQRSDHTIAAYARDVQQFFSIAAVDHPSNVNDTHVHGYLRALNNQKLSHKSIHRKLSALDQFWAFLMADHHAPSNPWRAIRRPRIRAKIPTYLEEHAMLELLENMPKETPIDCRNHAILELLFATGMRVAELIQLPMGAMDWEKNECRVLGKGQKERIALFGNRAKNAIQHYIHHARQQWCTGISNAVFISPKGHPLSARTIQRMVKAANQYHSSSVAITPHACRHTCASILLVHGASIRNIQELLGHSSIATTQRYAHVPAKQLTQRFLSAMGDTT